MINALLIDLLNQTSAELQQTVTQFNDQVALEPNENSYMQLAQLQSHAVALYGQMEYILKDLNKSHPGDMQLNQAQSTMTVLSPKVALIKAWISPVTFTFPRGRSGMPARDAYLYRQDSPERAIAAQRQLNAESQSSKQGLSALAFKK